ncbi:hypothetical protein TKK_0013715 [Trichogramma kaykai]
MSGINSEAVATFGRVTLKFFDKPCPLDILRDDFPIEYDGILGMEFLRTQKAHETYYLHARTKTLVDLDCDFEEGSSYVPCIRAGPGIFAGESLVKIQNYRAPLFITNSMSYDINLTLPPIKRCDFETSTRVRLARPKIKPPHGPETERIDSVLRELNLDSLNSDERAHIINLVAKFPQQFHLPSDHLSMTTASTHKIVTTDDIPINVKQYRHPPYLRDKIQKQITELITNDIVEESDSPYNSPLWIVPKKAGPDVEKKWRQEGHLEEFPYLDGLVSHLAIPSNGPDYRERVIDNVEISSEGKDTDDDMITGISLLPTGQPLKQQLLYLNYLDLELIKTQQLNEGAITESGLSTGHSLFSLFIRNNHEETPDIDIICEILTNLGASLVELERKSISIAKSNEHLDDMYWLPIETHLEELEK